MRSYLTEAEWADAFAHFGAVDPLGYRDVTQTQLSVARHYGGCTVNGQHFLHLPETDELLRSDVFKWAERRRADAVIAQRQAEEAAARAAQVDLFKS